MGDIWGPHVVPMEGGTMKVRMGVCDGSTFVRWVRPWLSPVEVDCHPLPQVGTRQTVRERSRSHMGTYTAVQERVHIK